MTQPINPAGSPQRSFLSGLLNFAVGGAILGGVVVLGLGAMQMMRDDTERSITAAIGAALGEAEGAHAEALMEQEANLRHRLALAEAEVRRVSDYYAAFYQAVGVAAQQASQWEGDLIRQQANAVANNNVVETFGANVLSIGCIGSAFDPSNREAREMCEAANRLGTTMVEDFSALPQYRPRYVETVLDDFPRPGRLISEEYRRVREEFPGAYPDAQQ